MVPQPQPSCEMKEMLIASSMNRSPGPHRIKVRSRAWLFCRDPFFSFENNFAFCQKQNAKRHDREEVTSAEVSMYVLLTGSSTYNINPYVFFCMEAAPYKLGQSLY